MRKKSSEGIKANGKFAFILFMFLICFIVMFGRVFYWKIVHGAEIEAVAKNSKSIVMILLYHQIVDRL